MMYASALKKLGLKKVARDQEVVLDGTEKLRVDLSLFGQLELLQAAHEAYRKSGSVVPLELMVEAYANLGVLTIDYWNSTSDVFAVRSLLYADLLVEKTDGAVRSVSHRAYAKALAGLHRWAAEDALTVLNTEDSGQKEELPIWNDLILPYCRFQPSNIEKICERKLALQPLSKLMQFRIAVSGNDSYLINAASKRLIRIAPCSFQTLPWLSQGPTHALMRGSALEYYATASNHKVREASSIPPEVAKILAGLRDRQDGPKAIEATSQISRMLMKSDSRPIEPSVNLTGRLIYEGLFVRVVEQLKEYSNGTKADRSAATDAVHEFVREHPYERYVKFLGIDQETLRQASSKLLDGFDFTDPRPNMSHACLLLFHIKTPQHDKLGLHVWRNIELDYSEPRMSQRLRGAQLLNVNQKSLFDMGKQLGRVSPYAPASVRLQISRLEKMDEKKVARYRKLTKEDPTGMEFLANKLQMLDRVDDAVELLDRAIKISPSVNRYVALANAHYAQGDFQQWKSTLLRHLKEENQGLSHAYVQNQLALGLMEQGKLDEAKPFALNAAQTWSGWGMKTASLVLECLEEWDESETWIQRTSQNYAGATRADWYLWCKRNGRGNLDGANDQFDTFLRSPYSKNQHDLYLKAIREILEDRPKSALKLLKQTGEFDQTHWSAQNAALVAAQSKDSPSLEDALDALKQQLESLDQESPRIEHQISLEVVRALSNSKDVKSPRYAMVDRILGKADVNSIADGCYVIGGLATLAGDADKAQEYWRRAVATRAFHRFSVTLAGDALHKDN